MSDDALSTDAVVQESPQETSGWTKAVAVAELRAAGRMVLPLGGRSVLLLAEAGERISALDNRCPHMGFPLHRGSFQDGILTCHWHHARFDVESGGTFDLWACDVDTFGVEVRGDEVWVQLPSENGAADEERRRLQVGMEQNLSFVIAKSAIALTQRGKDPVVPFRVALQFGVRHRHAGWGAGLTMHTAFMNLRPYLTVDDRSRAMYQGLAAVSREVAGNPPRFPVEPLPGSQADFDRLMRWFRRFVEVRDAEGAERCVASAVRGGADANQIARMLFAAATDHRYIDIGHPLDFTNKAFEALDHVGYGEAELVLGSLVRNYTAARRMEEDNAWRHPIDLVDLVEDAIEKLPAAFTAGKKCRDDWTGQNELVSLLLADGPHDTIGALLEALREGASGEQLAATVCHAAALRIAQFPTTNEFSDWDTALHTFTFANAVHQGLRRIDSLELLRGVLDAAMSVYLDRFLNVPAVRLPQSDGAMHDEECSLELLSELLDQRHSVQAAAQWVADYLRPDAGRDPQALLSAIGGLLLREDRDFHTIQCVEAAFRQYSLAEDSPNASHFLIAAARYLAAHAPTMRAQEQTFQIAQRLHRGESMFEEAEGLAEKDE